MDTTKRSPIDRLLFATFLKGRTSSRDIWEEKGVFHASDDTDKEKFYFLIRILIKFFFHNFL